MFGEYWSERTGENISKFRKWSGPTSPPRPHIRNHRVGRGVGVELIITLTQWPSPLARSSAPMRFNPR